MKKILLLFSCLTGLNAVHSQAIEDGKKYLYYQRYASAEDLFHHFLSQQPSNAEAWLLLTKSYLLQDKFQKAADSLALAPAVITEDPYFLIAKGSLCLNDNKQDSSRWYFDKAIDMTKGKDAGILATVADIEIMTDKGNVSYALETLQKAIKRNKNDASLHVLEGNAYRKIHDGGEAFKAYKNAIDKDKNLAEAYYLLGDLFLSQKNPDLYLEYFIQAVQADKNYGPAYYELYNYYVYTKPDAATAMQYFQQYAGHSDKTIRHDYSYTDLLYLNKNYQDAISNAKELINTENEKVQPRIYKLIAYSYAELKDTAHAIDYMSRYFSNEPDSNFIAKDFETMAELYASNDDGVSSAVEYYQRAAAISKDSSTLYKYYKDLVNLSAARKDYQAQAKWLGMYYSGNDGASNVDLFNWGIAAYRSGDYLLADSVFGLYTAKYPEQGFGYYWRARTNAVIDTGMTEGLAIPYYDKLTQVVNKDSLTGTDKKWVLEAYAYLAAYQANTQKDYEKAIGYFDKILEIDPENTNAKKYIPILEANAKKEKESSNN